MPPDAPAYPPQTRWSRRQTLPLFLMPWLHACGGGGSAGSTPGTGTPFQVDFVHHFDGTAGAPVGVVAGSHGAQIYTSFAAGYGTVFDATQRDGVRNTSARMSIAHGSDGDPAGADTGVGMGLWGAHITLPSCVHCTEGDTLHTVLVMRLDADFDLANNVGVLKFLRFFGHDTLGQVYGHVDHHLATYGYVEQDTPAPSPAMQTGWMWGNEADHAGEVFQAGYGLVSGVRSAQVLPRGVWFTLEFAQTFSSNPDLARRTTWLNGVRVADFHGNTKTWTDPLGNPATVAGGRVANLAPGVTIDSMRLFTYWNGYSPKSQGVNLDTLAFHRIVRGGSDAGLPAIDAQGRRMLGSSVV